MGTTRHNKGEVLLVKFLQAGDPVNVKMGDGAQWVFPDQPGWLAASFETVN